MQSLTVRIAFSSVVEPGNMKMEIILRWKQENWYTSQVGKCGTSASLAGTFWVSGKAKFADYYDCKPGKLRCKHY